MLIGQATLMVGNLHRGIYLLLQGELYHGSQDCRSVLPYLQLKLNILQLIMQVNRCFG